MQTSLDNFYSEYGIRNGQAPNETVLNRGLLRLKREIREIYSVLQIIQGKPIEEWNPDKIFELDEYVQYKGAIYKSILDTNYSMFPDGAEGAWEAVSFDTLKHSNFAFEHNYITATEGQTVFNVTFRISALPMVFVNGILISPDNYTWDSKSVTLKSAVALGRIVTVITGLAYESERICARRQIIATDDQYEFTVPFDLSTPSVFVNGILIGEDEYTYTKTSVTLDVPAQLGDVIVICNGALTGIETYTQDEVEELLKQYAPKETVYTKSEVDDALKTTKQQILADDSLAKTKDTVSKIQLQDSLNNFYTAPTVDKKLESKADRAESLSGYGIKDAYTQSETETKLNTKLNKSDFNRSAVMNLIQNNTEDGTGLNADTLQGLTAPQFMRTDAKTTNAGGIVVYNSQTETTASATICPTGTDPNTYISRSLGNGFQRTSKVVNTGTSNGMFFICEGDFYGTYWKNLYQFGCVNPEDYQWTVTVGLCGTGKEFDFVPKGYGIGSVFKAFSVGTPDTKNGAYTYGFVDDGILKVYAYVKTSVADFVKTYGHFQLLGIRKEFCTYVNGTQSFDPEDSEPLTKYDFERPYDMTDLEFEQYTEKALAGAETPVAPDVTADNALTVVDGDLSHEDSTVVYNSVDEGLRSPDVWLSSDTISADEPIQCTLYNGPAQKVVERITTTGDIEVIRQDLQFSNLGDLNFVIQAKSPFKTNGVVRVEFDDFKPLEINVKFKPLNEV